MPSDPAAAVFLGIVASMASPQLARCEPTHMAAPRNRHTVRCPASRRAIGSRVAARPPGRLGFHELELAAVAARHKATLF